MRLDCIRDIIETTVQYHSARCVFQPNAVEKIYQQVVNRMRFMDATDKEAVIDVLAVAVHDHEIYCSEGENRAMHIAVMGSTFL